jgi:hypothetical protein
MSDSDKLKKVLEQALIDANLFGTAVISIDPEGNVKNVDLMEELKEIEKETDEKH